MADQVQGEGERAVTPEPQLVTIGRSSATPASRNSRVNSSALQLRSRVGHPS
jgi:hypothetical protein